MPLEEYVNEVVETIKNSYEEYISIPNIYQNPYVIVPTLLGTEQYYFEYSWNIRHQKCYLSIFKIKNYERIYFLKNICLIKDIVLSDKINNTEFSGYLSFNAKEGVEDIYYGIKDISEKFEFFYTYRIQ